MSRGERLHDSTTKTKGRIRQGIESHASSGIVGRPHDCQQLSAHRSVASIGHTSEVAGEVIDGTVAGTIEEELLELLVGRRIDADAAVPLRLAATRRRLATAAVADRVSFELDWVPATVANLFAFLLFKPMVALGREQQEPILVTNVLHVGETATFAMGAFTFADGNVVLRDQLPVDRLRILSSRNPAGHVEPVAVTQVADGDLLNEPFGR